MGFVLLSNTTEAQVANCDPPTAETIIEINNVRARLLNGGDMWWNLFGSASASYEIPKGSGNNSMFSGALWMAGLDAGGNLLSAGQTYRQRGLDFWPGVLDNSGKIDSSTCKAWDRMFSVKRSEIQDVKDGNAPSASILNWPGSHAPFNDLNANGVYEPNIGEYPLFDPSVISNVPGEMVWWVINDVGGAHTAHPGGLPLGVEIQTTAYAYPTNNSAIVNNSTLYRFKIINKSASPIYSFYLGFFADPDLGGGNDDYIGCNISSRNPVFYCYNADEVDAQYGNKPPAVGLTFLRTLKNENGENVPVTSYMFFTNAGQIGINADPANATELYRYLRSYWADGQPLTYGTPDGRGGSGFTSYAFPGNLYSTTSWKETAAPGDRRILPSIGPTVLFPGAANEVIMATVWAQSDTGANRGSVAKLIRSVDTLHQIAATHFAGFSTGINLDKISVKAFPNPTTERLYIELENAYQQIEFTIYTLDGKKVKTESIENSRKSMLNVSSLLNGIYLLKINADGAERVLKFVKE
jgi:hypothetical protein